MSGGTDRSSAVSRYLKRIDPWSTRFPPKAANVFGGGSGAPCTRPTDPLWALPRTRSGR